MGRKWARKRQQWSVEKRIQFSMKQWYSLFLHQCCRWVSHSISSLLCTLDTNRKKLYTDKLSLKGNAFESKEHIHKTKPNWSVKFLLPDHLISAYQASSIFLYKFQTFPHELSNRKGPANINYTIVKYETLTKQVREKSRERHNHNKCQKDCLWKQRTHYR